MKKQDNKNVSCFAALDLLINDLKRLNYKKIPIYDYNQN